VVDSFLCLSPSKCLVTMMGNRNGAWPGCGAANPAAGGACLLCGHAVALMAQGATTLGGTAPPMCAHDSS
jgi:hypothetical protein